MIGASILLAPSLCLAYVGPGAGIAVGASALAFILSILVVTLTLLTWPIRLAYRFITKKKLPRPARIKRAILIGLDGLDPDRVAEFMAKGRLPNMERLAKAGGQSKLHTTFPSMSPVAWSSFATGVNPAKHGIFDFLTRDRRTYLPELSSTDIAPPAKTIKLGKFRIPLGKPQIRLLRKSKPFWELLAAYRVPCSILRLPITFPPQKFEGTMLSAMCVPDLQGSQGTFSHYSSQLDEQQHIGGKQVPVTVDDGVVVTFLYGPPNPIHADGPVLRTPMRFEIDAENDRATLFLCGKRIDLVVGKNSEWTEVIFRLGLGMKLRGICQVRLLQVKGQFRVYVTPINIDPSRPVMPISHPGVFATFLSKLVGRYATLGLAEDTWALNEGVLDEDAFLEQAWSNHREREGMFFEMLKRTRKGVLTCVFDGTDRIQHMFMRYLDDGHPAVGEDDRNSPYRNVIEDTYARMDTMLGKVMETIDINDPHNLLVVLSDHGFRTFRRGVNINAWLHQEGYLVLNEGASISREWFQDVNWDKTRAFALGLGGIFVNVKGREGRGIVAAGAEQEALAQELAAKLTGLIDTKLGTIAIQEAYPASALYQGPYKGDAPDVVVGYAAGWRASWSGVRGIVDGVIFDDNTKAWSGDHCIDPKLVPGILITNRKLERADGDEPHISDMAPTMLELFGVPAPKHMDGKSLAGAA